MFLPRSALCHLLLFPRQSNMYNWRHFRFLMDNGPFNIHTVLTKALDVAAENAVQNMKDMQSILMALMIFEGVFLLPVFGFIMLYTMRKLQDSRLSLFGVFLCVPRPAVIALASKDCNLDEDASDDEDLEEDGDWMKKMGDGADASAAGGAAAGSAGASGKSASNQPQKLIKINLKAVDQRRKLRSSNLLEILKVVAPFILYTALVLAITGSAMTSLDTTTEPLKDLIAAEKLLEYATRVRFWAHELVLAHTDADRDWYRWRLQIAATRMHTLYHR
jgi:hypothetical protein